MVFVFSLVYVWKFIGYFKLKGIIVCRRNWNIIFSRSFLYFWLCFLLLRLFVLCNLCMELNNVVGVRVCIYIYRFFRVYVRK